MEPTKFIPFDYTTKYLTNKDELIKKADDKKIDQLLTALEEGNWLDPIFERRSQIPYLALRCFRDNKITAEQFATLLTYWAVLRHHSHIEILPCQFEKSFDLVKQTFEVPEKIDAKHKDDFHKDPHLSPEQEARFLELMKETPASERYFFLIPDYQHNSGEENSITQHIAYAVGINVFNRVKVDGKTMRMIPSFSMMLNFLKAFVGDDFAVKLCPGIDLWEWEDIRQDNLDGRRVLGLPFPGISIPDEADGYSCPQIYDFIYHDFYHAFILSLIPLLHRKAFMAIEKVVSDFQKEVKNETQKLYLSQLSERLIDLELPSYRRETCQDFKERFQKNYSPDLIFWDALRDIILQTLERIHIQENKRLEKMYPEPIARLQADRLITQLQYDDNPIPQIAQRIFDSVSFEEFGIAIDSLEIFKPFAISDIKREIKKNHPTCSLEDMMKLVAKRDIILQLCDVKKKSDDLLCGKPLRI